MLLAPPHLMRHGGNDWGFFLSRTIKMLIAGTDTRKCGRFDLSRFIRTFSLSINRCCAWRAAIFARFMGKTADGSQASGILQVVVMLLGKIDRKNHLRTGNLTVHEEKSEPEERIFVNNGGAARTRSVNGKRQRPYFWRVLRTVFDLNFY